MYFKCNYGVVSICFGYITSTIKKSILNWNQQLGYGENVENSIGIYCSHSFKNFYMNKGSRFNEKLHSYETKEKLSHKDIFKVFI